MAMNVDHGDADDEDGVEDVVVVEVLVDADARRLPRERDDADDPSGERRALAGQPVGAVRWIRRGVSHGVSVNQDGSDPTRPTSTVSNAT